MKKKKINKFEFNSFHQYNYNQFFLQSLKNISEL